MAERKTKQVIVIRRDLKMRRGKEIAQGSHASMAFLTRRLQNHTVIDGSSVYVKNPIFSEAELNWIEGSFAKVTVQVDNESELDELYKKAIEAGLEAHLVTDSGRTEFNGVPTKTALAIGPDWSDKIDEITGSLKLY